jgi:hypothetical protein
MANSEFVTVKRGPAEVFRFYLNLDFSSFPIDGQTNGAEFYFTSHILCSVDCGATRYSTRTRPWSSTSS